VGPVRLAKEKRMTETTKADRERELAALLGRIADHPEKEWRNERARVAVLQRMLAAEQAAD
jgi:hypothetical protein